MKHNFWYHEGFNRGCQASALAALELARDADLRECRNFSDYNNYNDYNYNDYNGNDGRYRYREPMNIYRNYDSYSNTFRAEENHSCHRRESWL